MLPDKNHIHSMLFLFILNSYNYLLYWLVVFLVYSH